MTRERESIGFDTILSFTVFRFLSRDKDHGCPGAPWVSKFVRFALSASRAA